MGLQISSRKSGGITILEVRGRITIGRGNDALSTELRKLAEAGPCNVIVNLAGVTQVDSSGISTIVRTFVTAERRGGQLKLLNPTGHVREVLELTRLIRSIPTYEDEATALASFHKSEGRGQKAEGSA
jgi:anti-sigma B factor antagonist